MDNIKYKVFFNDEYINGMSASENLYNKAFDTLIKNNQSVYIIEPFRCSFNEAIKRMTNILNYNNIEFKVNYSSNVLTTDYGTIYIVEPRPDRLMGLSIDHLFFNDFSLKYYDFFTRAISYLVRSENTEHLIYIVTSRYDWD